MYNLSAYVPEPLLPQFEAFQNALVSWLELLGIVNPSKSDAADDSRAKKAYNDADHSLKLTRDELTKAKEDLSRLFDSSWYGKDGEWKKLDGTCLEKDTGE